MTDLELLLEVGRNCVDMQLCRVFSDYRGEHLALAKTHSLVFGEGLSRSKRGSYVVPGFLHSSGLYPEYYSVYLRALSAPDWVREQYAIWQDARKALPYLKCSMPYEELLSLAPDMKAALLMHESRRVDSLEDASEYIDGFTSGHHRDVLDLLTNAVNNVPPGELRGCWVYMDEVYLIQFDHVLDNLQCFRCDYIVNGADYKGTHEIDEDLAQSLDRICATSPENIDEQVNREIIRYWNDRVKNLAGDPVSKRLRARSMTDIFTIK